MKSKGWLSYSNVVATVALFVALGGGAWALSKNSIDSREIKKDAVRSSEIDNETIKGKDVKPEALDAGEIADGSIGAAEIADAAVGAGEIADGSVGSAKIPSNAVGAAKIAANAVGSSEIAANAVGTGEVADGGLTGGDIAGDSLTGAHVNESSLGIVPNAGQLDGRSVVSGSGNLGASSPEVIATLPALGAQLQTDGDPDADFTISLANTGAATINFFCPNGGGIALPTGVVPSGVTTDNTMVCMAWNEADPSGPSRSLIFCSDDVFDGVARCEVLRA